MPNRRIPDDEKVIKGTFKKHRAHRPGPKAKPLAAAPRHLSKAERAVWKEIVAAAPENTLTAADQFVLAAACRLEAEYRETGTTMTASKVSALLKIYGKLGMNPVDRARLPVPKQMPENVFDEF